MPKKIQNMWKYAKFELTTSAIQKQTERKILPQYSTSYIVDVHLYKKIFR